MKLANNTTCRRNGLSVIEVLTAIVVALIGVTGVLIMIPFAVSQAEVGMDTEKAVDLARNATEELAIRGVLEFTPIVTHPVIAGSYLPVTNATARCFCLDPSGVADRVAGGNDTGSFPFIHPAMVTSIFGSVPVVPGTTSVAVDQTCLFQRASIPDPRAASTLPVPVIIPLRKALARAAFSWQDDLQTRSITDQEFADPTVNVGGQYLSKDLTFPIPIFDQTVTSTGTVLNARRQSLGEMSMVVISCPAVITPRIRTVPLPAPSPSTADFNRDNTGRTVATKTYPSGVPPPATLPNQLGDADDVISEVRSFYLVYKRRSSPTLIDDPSTAAPATGDPQNYDRIFAVDWPGNAATGVGDAAFRVTYNGGMLKMREPGLTTNPATVAGANVFSKQRADVRRGDWMALTNVNFDYGTGRFQHNINFFQVETAYIATDSAGPHWAITLKGPEWDFQRDYFVDSNVTPGPGGFPRIPRPIDPSYWPDPPGTFNLTPTTFAGGFAAEILNISRTNFHYRPSQTMAIHLPDVWTVFEQTTRIGD